MVTGAEDVEAVGDAPSHLELDGVAGVLGVVGVDVEVAAHDAARVDGSGERSADLHGRASGDGHRHVEELVLVTVAHDDAVLARGDDVGPFAIHLERLVQSTLRLGGQTEGSGRLGQGRFGDDLDAYGQRLRGAGQCRRDVDQAVRREDEGEARSARRHGLPFPGISREERPHPDGRPGRRMQGERAGDVAARTADELARLVLLEHPDVGDGVACRVPHRAREGDPGLALERPGHGRAQAVEVRPARHHLQHLDEGALPRRQRIALAREELKRAQIDLRGELPPRRPERKARALRVVPHPRGLPLGRVVSPSRGEDPSALRVEGRVRFVLRRDEDVFSGVVDDAEADAQDLGPGLQDIVIERAEPVTVRKDDLVGFGERHLRQLAYGPDDGGLAVPTIGQHGDALRIDELAGHAEELLDVLRGALREAVGGDPIDGQDATPEAGVPVREAFVLDVDADLVVDQNVVTHPHLLPGIGRLADLILAADPPGARLLGGQRAFGRGMPDRITGVEARRLAAARAAGTADRAARAASERRSPAAPTR